MRLGKYAKLRILPAVALLVAGAACGGEPHGEPVRFRVPAGSGMSAVADTLAARDIVENAQLFQLYARLKGVSRSIKPGTYEMQRGTGWGDVLDKLVAGDVVRFRLTVPEGWEAALIAQRVAAATESDPDSVLALVESDSVADALGVPADRLEGYLYPATYSFPAGTAPERVVETMVRRYSEVWTPEMRERADSLEMSEHEIVTLASIVEKEARHWGERDTIAAVYHNRLRRNMRLQADPTIQYALGERQSRLLYAHIDSVADHPYNTYARGGLPPGPIGSPSEGTIRAALYPAEVDYLYFVAEPDGRHRFTRTLTEHNRAKQQIRRQLDAAERRELDAADRLERESAEQARQSVPGGDENR